MCVICKAAYATTAGVVSLSNATAILPQAGVDNIRKNVQQSEKLSSAVSRLSKIVSEPKWYQERLEQEGGASGAEMVVNYTVSIHGNIRSSIEEFASLADETLNDSRGWARLGVKFVRVESGGRFNLILSEASRVPDFSADGCDTTWSCRVGDNVIINDDRWSSASDAWSSARGGMRDYRHMVINHEVGHWLGHDHYYCAGAGQSAPVMQQQSIDLQGCKFNPWPQDKELSSTQLGIDKRS